MSILATLLLTGALLPACASATPPTSPSTAATPLAQLSWMAGAWRGVDDGALVEEHWTAEGGGTMMGVNRVIVGEETVFFEYLQIESTADGVVYRAWPKGESATTFRMTLVQATRATFENPSHDFPRVITYWREGDALHARAEGVEDGKSRTTEWVWERYSGTP